jgi:hypothetical protein
MREEVLEIRKGNVWNYAILQTNGDSEKRNFRIKKNRMKVYIIDSSDTAYPVDDAAIFAQSNTAIGIKSSFEDEELLLLKPIRQDGEYCRREAIELVIRMIERHGSKSDTYPRFDIHNDRFRTDMIAKADKDDVKTACDKRVIADVISAFDFLGILFLLEIVSRCLAEYVRGMNTAQIQEMIKF